MIWIETGGWPRRSLLGHKKDGKVIMPSRPDISSGGPEARDLRVMRRAARKAPRHREAVDFANILFAGPCNRTCPFCIGKLVPGAVIQDNLDLYPPLNIDGFITQVNRLGIRQIVFTGTTTDPQLYRHESRLLVLLRSRVVSGAEYSVHTNGVLALRKLDVFNEYDRACISFPSFAARTYEKMMGSRRVPDLESIIARANIPVKVSCVVNEHNVAEIDDFLVRCAEIGVRRVVLRKLYGEKRDWPVLTGAPVTRFYRGNPVYEIEGMEVTRWDFDVSTSTSINLFADGTIGSSYLLAETPQFRARSSNLRSPAC
jgi:hypothetical protein